MLPSENKRDVYMRRLFFAVDVGLYSMLLVNVPNQTSVRVPMYCRVCVFFFCVVQLLALHVTEMYDSVL